MRTHAHTYTHMSERNSSSGRGSTRDLHHRRLSTAFSWPGSRALSSPPPPPLPSSSRKQNTVVRRDSLAAHRPMHSGERTCLLSHDNNDGDNWPPSLRTPRVNRR